MSKLKAVFALFKMAFEEWSKDRAPRLAAALAYYTTFSIAPFLVVVIAIAGLIAGRDAVQGSLDEQIQGLVGRESADMIQQLIQNASKPSENILATVIGIVTLLLGAGGVFGQLQDALNTVWGVEVKPGRGILATVKDRFLSFSMVLGVGFLLMVSLMVSSFLASVHTYFLGLLPGAEFILQVLNLVLSFGVITLLFAMIYKLLPDVKIQWRDVWIGAAFTALLFTIGKTLLGIYLGNSDALSAYGAAGSLIIILLWIFYSAQILLFGAEFTQVYAREYGSHIVPSENAVAVTDEARAQAGMSPAADKAAPNTKSPVSNTSGASTPAKNTGDETNPDPQPARSRPIAHRLPAAAHMTVPPAKPVPQTEPGPFVPAVTIFAAFFAFLIGLVFGTQRDD